jgi:hypothetical protein
MASSDRVSVGITQQTPVTFQSGGWEQATVDDMITSESGRLGRLVKPASFRWDCHDPFGLRRVTP